MPDSPPGSGLPARLNAALTGRYRIEGRLGEGGMATVYLAEDLKHERRVALKVLKPELAAVIGAERFLAEIKTTANLQHPHILPLFDSGEADGFLFYVMPFIDGESLRERIDREKQLPVEEAVRVAAAVGSALDYAHRQGIVHRDIKPANILVHDGEPLVADFGIALAVSEAGAGRLTETGLSLGTPHYMSPEQATADRTPGPQSDIYALGCVTYEMLTGAPPFAAPTAQAVLMQILTEDPKPVTAVRRAVPPHVEAAVERALEKLPADRFRTAGDYVRALKDPALTGAERGRRGNRVPRGGPASLMARFGWPAATAAAILAAVLGWAGRTGAPTSPVNRLSVPGSADWLDAMALSPDGRMLASLRSVAGSTPAIFVRRLDSYEERLAANSQAAYLTFSPDGSQLAFHDNDALQVTALTGGGLRGLTNDLAQNSMVHWDDDGWIYFTSSSGSPARVRASGGDAEIIATEAEGYVTILDVFDAGRAAVALQAVGTGPGTLGVLDLESGTFRGLFEGSGARILDDRYLVWARGTTLQAQRFDPATRTLDGSPVVILEGVAVTATRAPLWAVSDNGTLVYREAAPLTDNLIEVSRQGVRTQLGRTVDSDIGFRLSPDGARLVFDDRTAPVSDVYTLDLATGIRERLTFDANAIYPTWTPDGSRVAYYRSVDGEYALYWQEADGSGVEEVLLDTPDREIEVEFLPAGDSMLVRVGDRARSDGADIFLYAVGDPESGRPIADGPGSEVAPRVSPDGRFVAYTSDELGTGHVFVRAIADPRQRWQISDGQGGTEPSWNPDGTEIFYRNVTDLMVVPVRLTPTFRRTGEPAPLFPVTNTLDNSNHALYHVTPDGQSFLFLEAPRASDTRIVLNWIDELRQLLGS